jgi:hypothetical protein
VCGGGWGQEREERVNNLRGRGLHRASAEVTRGITANTSVLYCSATDRQNPPWCQSWVMATSGGRFLAESVCMYVLIWDRSVHYSQQHISHYRATSLAARFITKTTKANQYVLTKLILGFDGGYLLMLILLLSSSTTRLLTVLATFRRNILPLCSGYKWISVNVLIPDVWTVCILAVLQNIDISYSLQPWRWRKQVPPKLRQHCRPYCDMR